MAMTMINAVFWDAIPCIIAHVSAQCAAFTHPVHVPLEHK